MTTTLSFGLISAPHGAAQWREHIRWAQDHGYSTVLLPDTLRTPSPFPALAAAAAVTSTLRVRPWVLAAPLRHPTAVVRDAAALQLLSDGRFELGIGAGRPEAAAEAAQLGVEWGTGAIRRAQVRETALAVRESVRPTPPVIVAAAGPIMLAEAAGYADRIALAAGPRASIAEVGELAEIVRSVRPRPLSQALIGIGNRLQQWIGRQFDIDQLRGAAGVLPADPDEAVATLLERRDRLGIDEFLVTEDLAEAFAPVLARLTA